MDTTQRVGILQRGRVVQHELMPELRQEIGPLTPRLEKLIRTHSRVWIEESVESTWSGKGRLPHDRGALSNVFVAKAMLGLGTTAALIERLQMDRALKRIELQWDKGIRGTAFPPRHSRMKSVTRL